MEGLERFHQCQDSQLQVIDPAWLIRLAFSVEAIIAP
jgi:hypothetical protein